LKILTSIADQLVHRSVLYSSATGNKKLATVVQP
jgi:hypothetical protein